MIAIQARGLRKAYGATVAVDGLDLAVETGELVALLGPNGAGKTTTVEVLEGYRRPDEGTVSVLGHDPFSGSRELREQVGIVLQDVGVEPYLTAREVLRRVSGHYPRPRRTEELLELVGLADKADQRVNRLSGGQKRRLDLALALVGQPRVLFLDEPTTGFDPEARREAWALVRSLREQGTTILLTTHYLDEAEALADRVLVIRSGRIVADAPPATLGGRDRAPVEIRFRVPAGFTVEDLPVLAEQDGDWGSMRSDDPTRALQLLTGWALQRGLRVEGLSVNPPSLEDVYVGLLS